MPTGRVIQQAITQVLTPIFDPEFSESSYGFRPGRSAHDAVRQALRYQQGGKQWVVDLDLQQFFDEVNHDILMARIGRKVKDKRMKRLINAYLKVGVMEPDGLHRMDKGTPQGGPLSPLLSNILLDDLDMIQQPQRQPLCCKGQASVHHQPLGVDLPDVAALLHRHRAQTVSCQVAGIDEIARVLDRQDREPLAFLQTLLTDSPEAAEALLYRQAPDLDDSS